ncbi:pseudouridine synthase [Candidatus Nitronereus thalassa]|uniref:Pseudouridine synthase n=1 Tax=Candidatus Nitronereus thalassa TaxID=3020898 RepID=A0ABU3KBS0_9BACT|nr:pseudouridine synthase [Candidatus Nitronereus thalassa]MDT7043886.1 pseudouridine synthase [Candidatus Nitronereus thalassa]
MSEKLSAMTTKPTLILNKPYGVLSCFTDELRRPTLAEYISVPDVYAAGRLDLDSEGLLLLTADGMLAHRLTDPEHKLPKVYLVQVERIPDATALDQLRNGVVIRGRTTRPAHIQLLEEPPNFWDRPVPIRFRKSVPTSWLEMTITEGMNRQIRRMTAAVGNPTLRIIRIAIGGLKLGDLMPGEYREVTKDEMKTLFTGF